MDYYYDIIPEGKKTHLYRIEPDKKVKIASADDVKSTYQLQRMKDLFEEDPFPLEELHAAEARKGKVKKSTKPNWASCGLVGGAMEVWEATEHQVNVLKLTIEKGKDGLHPSTAGDSTIACLIKHGLVKKRKQPSSYIIITEAGSLFYAKTQRGSA